jgi:hypothetical protein
VKILTPSFYCTSAIGRTGRSSVWGKIAVMVGHADSVGEEAVDNQRGLGALAHHS